MIPLPWRPTQSYLLWDLSSKDRNSLALQKRALLALQEPGIWSLLDVDRVCISVASHVRLSEIPLDCSLPCSSVHGILQARILECVVISCSRGSSQPRSPVWQADSLPSEPPGKPKTNMTTMHWPGIKPGLPRDSREFYHGATNAPTERLFKRIT